MYNDTVNSPDGGGGCDLHIACCVFCSLRCECLGPVPGNVVVNGHAAFSERPEPTKRLTKRRTIERQRRQQRTSAVTDKKPLSYTQTLLYCT